MLLLRKASQNMVLMISFIFMIITRLFMHKLNLSLAELNHVKIDHDKYYIFKYCIPLMIVSFLMSAFGILIAFFI